MLWLIRASVAVSMVAAVFLLAGDVPPFGSFLWTSIGLHAAVISLVPWLIALPMVLKRHDWARLWRLAVPIVAIGAGILLSSMLVPFKLGFWLSRVPLERLVSGTEHKDTVGVYPVDSIFRSSEGVIVWVRGAGFPGRAGLAYCVGKVNENVPVKLASIEGSWFRIYASPGTPEESLENWCTTTPGDRMKHEPIP